mgnify:CR=1 FL=1
MASKHGKPVFCEKPISLSLPETDRALKAISDSKTPLMLGFNRRYDPSHRSVRDNVAYGLRVQGLPRVSIDARVAQMLELVRLPQLATRRPGELSGGEQQRVALARALALDEISTGLDSAVTFDIVKRLRERGAFPVHARPDVP